VREELHDVSEEEVRKKGRNYLLDDSPRQKTIPGEGGEEEHARGVRDPFQMEFNHNFYG